MPRINSPGCEEPSVAEDRLAEAAAAHAEDGAEDARSPQRGRSGGRGEGAVPVPAEHARPRRAGRRDEQVRRAELLTGGEGGLYAAPNGQIPAVSTPIAPGRVFSQSGQGQYSLNRRRS